MADKKFDLGDYIDVAARMAELRDKYPDGRFQPADLAHPYRIETIGSQTFVVYVAACYRDAEDTLPGIGTAWEPVPGLTPYTKNSEIQNAETSAWGRAMVAALVADTKRGIATAEDVRNRHEERDAPPEPLATYAQVLDLAARLRATLVDTDGVYPPEWLAEENRLRAKVETLDAIAAGDRALPTVAVYESAVAALDRADLALALALVGDTPCEDCGSSRSERVLHDGRVICALRNACAKRAAGHADAAPDAAESDVGASGDDSGALPLDDGEPF